MMNGFALRVGSLACTVVLVLSGCARDRLVNPFSNTKTTQQEHAASTSSVAVSQKSCPVTGEALDSMGGSIPVTAMGETIYVCCRGCVKAVEKNPEKYLAIVRSES